MKTRAHAWPPQILSVVTLLCAGSLVMSCKERKVQEPPPTIPKGDVQSVSTQVSAPTSERPIGKPASRQQPESVASTAKPQQPALSTRRTPQRRASDVVFPPFEGKTVAVIHTVNMVGEIEPCG